MASKAQLQIADHQYENVIVDTICCLLVLFLCHYEKEIILNENCQKIL